MQTAIDELILVRPSAGHGFKDLHPEFRPHTGLFQAAVGRVASPNNRGNRRLPFESPSLILYVQMLLYTQPRCQDISEHYWRK